MDMVTRWSNGSDSEQAAPSQTKPAWSAPDKVAAAPPDEVARIRNALDLAMQELDHALQLKRSLRARVAEMCCTDSLAA